MTRAISIKLLFFILCFWAISSFAQREIKPCQQVPAFIKKLGFDPLWTALSTSEKHQMGLVLIELLKNGDEKTPGLQSIRGRTYQDSSWQKAGYLAGIALDVSGNIYSIPAPLVSVLNNRPKDQNQIYRVDAQTGIMNKWLVLPNRVNNDQSNPYGLIGITYDCSFNELFVATIAGSKRFEEKGIIYAIQPNTKKIVDSITGIDAMGLTVFFDTESKKRLYFGKTRSGEIWSVPIEANGKFIKNKMQKECSLAGLGPRGDDKPRKMKFTNGALVINGIAFNYNLQASSEKPETTYIFNWNLNDKKWILTNLY